jgi:hypothetical protein
VIWIFKIKGKYKMFKIISTANYKTFFIVNGKEVARFLTEEAEDFYEVAAYRIAFAKIAGALNEEIILVEEDSE